jgi:predicted aspartyl protease
VPPIIIGPGALPPGSNLTQQQLVAQFGCRVAVTLSVPQAQRELITSTGGTPAAPVVGAALLDTGATGTCIDDGIATSLGLRQVGTVTISTPDGTSPHPQYLVEVELAGVPGTALWTVTGAALAAQRLVALIGTDVMQNGVFAYNGKTGAFSLSF